MRGWYKPERGKIEGQSLPVSVYPCSNCGQRAPGRMAALYAAWFVSEGERVCYRERLCAACVTIVRDSLLVSVSDSSPNVSVCPLCGEDSSTNMSPLYLTIYLPKQEAREFALTTCTSCVSPYLASFAEKGDKMADRGGGQVGAAAAAQWENIL